MLNQPSNITPDEINGSGCVDVSQDLPVSWQVSGDSPMSAYQITFYKNDAASTQILTTGKKTLDTPWWGVNYAGDVQFFETSVSASSLSGAGMANGNEYKLLIVQWSASNDYGKLYTATGSLAAGKYYIALSSSEYAVFTLDRTLASGDTIRYSQKNQTVSVTASGFFYTLTATKATAASGTALSASDYTGGEEYVLQTTPSVFLARSAPTVTITNIPSPLTVKEYSFTATYAQAQGDAMKWVRWQLADKGDTDNPFLDTGTINGTGELRVDYNGFLTDNSYSIQCSVETANGVDASTGWIDFDVSYEVGEASGSVTACQLANQPCVYIQWTADPLAYGYTILRQTVGDTKLKHIAYVGTEVTELRDYGARSGNTYIYYVFPEGSLTYLTSPMVSDETKVQFWFWTIIEAKYNSETDYYDVVSTHFFRYGKDGVSTGTFSNNNSPSISRNFTRYPIRQPDSCNYLTGSVSGYIGSITGAKEYSDTVKESDSLMELSTSTNSLFLLNPKGHFLKIHTASATSVSIDYKSKQMPQTGTLSWVEVGSADDIAVVSATGSEFYPTDNIAFTTITLDPTTGRLLWSVVDDYENGSVLSADENGSLIQTIDGSFTAATMKLDQDTGKVTATI